MILFGCLLAFSAAVAPRLVLILAWIFSDRWPVVWGGDWIMPLLGIIFLPYTTIMYLLSVVVLPGGETTITGTGWLWIILGLFLDFMKWSQMFANRKEAAKQTTKYYPSGAPRMPTGSSGSTSTAAAAATTAPAPADSQTPAKPAAPEPPASPEPAPAPEAAAPDAAATDGDAKEPDKP